MSESQRYFPSLPTIDLTNTCIVPKKNPVPLQVYEKRRQTDVNPTFSSPRQVRKGKGRNLTNPPPPLLTPPLQIFDIYSTT